MPPIKESKLRAMIRTELKKRLLREQDDASIEGQQLQTKLKQALAAAPDEETEEK